MQRSIIFPRHQIPLSTGTADHIPGLEKKWLQTEFAKIETWYIPPARESQAGPAPAVIFAHGNAELIDYWPEELQRFSRMGIALLLYILIRIPLMLFETEISAIVTFDPSYGLVSISFIVFWLSLTGRMERT